jgi:predicted RNA binding protein YcfA (HicA-like mRNA interferase family)
VTRLPQVSASRLLRALRRAGFVEVHCKGSHVTLVHEQDPNRVAVVPVHKGHDIKPGTLHALLKGARLTIDELRRLL